MDDLQICSWCNRDARLWPEVSARRHPSSRLESQGYGQCWGPSRRKHLLFGNPIRRFKRGACPRDYLRCSSGRGPLGLGAPQPADVARCRPRGVHWVQIRTPLLDCGQRHWQRHRRHEMRLYADCRAHANDCAQPRRSMGMARVRSGWRPSVTTVLVPQRDLGRRELARRQRLVLVRRRMLSRTRPSGLLFLP
jgi:hypothetical protein